MMAALISGRDRRLYFGITGDDEDNDSKPAISFVAILLFQGNTVVSSFEVMGNVLFNASFGDITTASINDWPEMDPVRCLESICDGEKKNAPGVSRKAMKRRRWGWLRV